MRQDRLLFKNGEVLELGGMTNLSVRNLVKRKWKVSFENARHEIHTEFFVLEKTARAYAKHIDSVLRINARWKGFN